MSESTTNPDEAQTAPIKPVSPDPEPAQDETPPANTPPPVLDAQTPVTPAPPEVNNVLAVTSMVCGIIAVPSMFFFGLGLGPAIAGAVTGHLALKQVKEEGRTDRGGKNFAVTGLATSYGAMALALVLGSIALVVGLVMHSDHGHMDEHSGYSYSRSDNRGPMGLGGTQSRSSEDGRPSITITGPDGSEIPALPGMPGNGSDSQPGQSQSNDSQPGHRSGSSTPSPSTTP